jgi:enoyl-CoA hydratase/carnithine racemase
VTEHLRLEVDGPVAVLTIDRPAKRNALSLDMWAAIPSLVSKAAQARVLIIRGTDHFSAGADIAEFATLRAGAEGALRYGAVVHAAERAIATLDRPTIAAIRGACVGGGCEIALACDIRIAGPDARFGITPAKLGIVYNLTSTKQLVDAVGPAWAKQILCSGEIIDAATALRIGLVNELHEDPVARAGGLAATIAARAQVSVRGAKSIVGRIMAGQVDEDDAVRALYAESAASADYAEGVAAFLEKRPPRF